MSMFVDKGDTSRNITPMQCPTLHGNQIKSEIWWQPWVGMNESMHERHFTLWAQTFGSYHYKDHIFLPLLFFNCFSKNILHQHFNPCSQISKPNTPFMVFSAIYQLELSTITTSYYIFLFSLPTKIKYIVWTLYKMKDFTWSKLPSLTTTKLYYCTTLNSK